MMDVRKEGMIIPGATNLNPRQMVIGPTPDFVPRNQILLHSAKIVWTNAKNVVLITFGVIKTPHYGDIVRQINY